MKVRNEIALVWIVTGKGNARAESRRREFAAHFGQTIIVAKEGGAGSAEDLAGEVVSFAPDRGKVWALNEAVRRAESSFVLWVEDDEYWMANRLPETLSSNLCYQALIDSCGENASQRNYQIRLFPSPGEDRDLFDGFSIPELSRSFTDKGWELSEAVIPVQKTAPLFGPGQAAEEAAATPPGPMSLYWEAVLDGEKQKYASAEQKLKRVLANRDLFEFDYLAALNGLANALVEQHKLEEALEVVNRSLTCNVRQRAPYLLLSKIYQSCGMPEEAHQALNDYLDVLRYASHANLDIFVPRVDCHLLMADSAFRQGNFERAFLHYERYFELNDGKVPSSILERLFIYAIELGDYEKSVTYFHAIFGDTLPGTLDEEAIARLLEALSLFMDNEWYDFVSGVYEQLVSQNPGDNQLLHGWITTLIKNNEIDKAQTLAAIKKSR